MAKFRVPRALPVPSDFVRDLLGRGGLPIERGLGVAAKDVKLPHLVWMTTGKNPCPRCVALNERVDGDGWSSTAEPGEGGPPPLHVGCECVVVDMRDLATEAWAKSLLQ